MRKNDTLQKDIFMKNGEPIDYPDAFEIQLSKNLKEYSIYILPPFKNFKDYIFLFPDSSSERISNNELISHNHNNFIFYKNKWYTPRVIFKKIPKNFAIFAEGVMIYCERYLHNKNYYKIPYKYFDQTSVEQVGFKQKAIQPIRNLFSKYFLLKAESRGRGSKEERRMREIRRKIVVSAYRKAKRKKPTPIKFIQDQWKKEVLKRFLDNQKLYDKYTVGDATIRRDLKQEGLI